jgi:hypothetical protein
MTREPAIMPIAKTPTAIESTTSSVRILLPHRSRNTLRQRGLSMCTHLLFGQPCGAILGLALISDLVDRLRGFGRLGHQMAELVAVERYDLDAGV